MAAAHAQPTSTLWSLRRTGLRQSTARCTAHRCYCTTCSCTQRARAPLSRWTRRRRTVRSTVPWRRCWSHAVRVPRPRQRSRALRLEYMSRASACLLLTPRSPSGRPRAARRVRRRRRCAATLQARASTPPATSSWCLLARGRPCALTGGRAPAGRGAGRQRPTRRGAALLTRAARATTAMTTARSTVQSHRGSSASRASSTKRAGPSPQPPLAPRGAGAGAGAARAAGRPPRCARLWRAAPRPSSHRSAAWARGSGWRSRCRRSAAVPRSSEARRR